MERYNPQTQKWTHDSQGEGWFFPWLAIGCTIFLIVCFGGFIVSLF